MKWRIRQRAGKIENEQSERKCKRKRSKGGREEGEQKRMQQGGEVESLSSFVTSSTERNNNYRKMTVFSYRPNELKRQNKIH